MSYNLLAYAIPVRGFLNALGHLLPARIYGQYEQAPISPHAAVVERTVLRALTGENSSEAQYSERVKEMLQDLPDTATSKDIMALFANRFKVTSMNNGYGISATGTDVDALGRKGKYYITIDPNADSKLIDALPWFSTHEVCHILESDWVEISCVKATASLVTTFVTTYLLGWSLLPAIGAALFANTVTYSIMSHRAENRADCFANKHCTPEEKEKAIIYLKSEKQKKQEGITSYLRRFFGSLSHPSLDERIANINRILSKEK